MRIIRRMVTFTFSLMVLALYLTQPTSRTDGVDTEARWAQEFPKQFVMNELDIKPGDRVADLGCSWGQFTYDLARQVGSTGSVYAVDIDQEAVEFVRAGRKAYDLPHIIPVWSVPTDPMLPQGDLSHVVIANAYHEMTEHKLMLRGIARSLVRGGKLAIIDKNTMPGRTHEQYAQEHAISFAMVIDEIMAAGFKYDRKINPPNKSAGEYFFLTFERP